ncbi:sugar ABC transporter permease [Chania multitudinisentens RB-25]|uniref:Sugar ABC transporter permease n=1 Tax=Chania multitudinisentens RB-25 TaxID=1441930 RepID=W0LDW3_9GAMM|nr:carbohydrate ABC transporter permease [Chania multitudinisentens]AHG21896.1 sugar ABC transporter permease [Chania multitudinisentens RB-25]
MISTPFSNRSDKVFGATNSILLVIFCIAALYPIIYVLSISMSTGASVTTGRVFLFPVDIDFSAYGRVFKDRLFWTSYANTLFYTVFGVITSLFFIVPGAYALSKARLKGRRVFGFFIAFTMWFHAGMIPFFLNMRDLALLDSRFGILIGFACSAFNIILMRNYFESIPSSFEEAARMDGANDFQILWKVYIPLAKPALATVTLLCAIARWNGYFWAMVLLRTEEKIPLQVYLKKTIVDLNVNEEFAGALLSNTYSMETVVGAIIIMSLIPVIIVYPIVQKYFTKGVMLGGIKE